MRKALVIISALTLVAFALQFIFAAVGGFTKPAGAGACRDQGSRGAHAPITGFSRGAL